MKNIIAIGVQHIAVDKGRISQIETILFIFKHCDLLHAFVM